MKKITMLAVLGVFVFGFVFSSALPAMAEPGNPIKGISVKGGHNPSSITAIDLDITNVGTLPTSRLYFFKEWKRGISRLFTFNKVAKAELELEITNQIAAEIVTIEGKHIKKAILTAGREMTTGLDVEYRIVIVKALKNYTKAQDRLKARLAKLTENSENPKIAKLLEKVDEKIAKHLMLLNQLSKNKVFVFGGDDDCDNKSATPIKDDDCDSPDPVAGKQTQGATFGEKVNMGLRAGSCNNREKTPSGDDDCDGMELALENAQEKLHDTVVSSAEKDSNIKQKAADQIACAEEALSNVKRSKSNISSNRVGGTTEPADAGRVKCWAYNASGDLGTSDNIGSQASENCGLCLDFLKRAKEAFAEEKYGEAFALARRSQVTFGWVFWTNAKTAPAPKGDFVDKSVTPTIPTPKPRSIPENSLKSPQSIISFKECAAAGYPIMESYPGQCRVTETGKLFIEIITEAGAITPTPRTIEPRHCTMQYDPVCGADGNTYGNSCEAGVANVAVKYAGKCDAGTTNSDGTRTQY